MNFEIIMPSKKKSPYSMMPFLWNSRKCKLFHGDRKQTSSCREGEAGRRGRQG